jgi:class 3 adenylate cyclase
VKFRAKILLAILLPASLLVAAAVSGALLEIGRASRDAVEDEFARAKAGFARILDRQRADLAPFVGEKGHVEGKEVVRPGLFDGPWFQEFVKGGLDPEARPALSRHLDLHLNEINVQPDYFAAADSNGRIWLRRYKAHVHGASCSAGEETGWAPRPREILFRGHDGAYLALRIDYAEVGVEGGLVVGKNISPALGELREGFKLELALTHEGRPVYSSLAQGGAPGEGELRLGGRRFVADRTTLGALGELYLYRSMAREDEQQREAVLYGLAGLVLAVLVAAGVSARVSRGISRPVELLVGATRRVGAGDYSAKVEIPGRDEMAALGSAFNDMTEGLRKRREIMEKTLSRDVAEKLMEGVELGGERRRVTVMFMDVRGFTPATEGVDPAEVVAMLNDMMAFLAEPIARHGGNVNKFLGDGLMAMFGAPRDLPDHAVAAARAALEMQKGMKEWNGRRSGRGLPPLQIGIGINTGVVVGGNVGSKDRLEYTLIGEEVNLSSRICGKARPGQILVTRQTLGELADRVRVRELEPVQVKGLSYPVQVYEVVA